MNISTPYFKENNNDENYIPLAKPSITKKEIAYVNEAMINGWGENKSKFIEKFELTFAKKIGAKFALMVNSGSSANLPGLAPRRAEPSLGSSVCVYLPSFSVLKFTILFNTSIKLQFPDVRISVCFCERDCLSV